jgi:YbbR domain-containing protein
MKGTLRTLFQWLRDNFSSMVLSLLLALIIWIIVARETNPVTERAVAVNVEVNGPDRGMLVISSLPTTAEVRVRATESTWPLTSQEVSTILDLTGLGAGLHQVPLEARMVPGLQAVLGYVIPASVQVEIVEESERELPVQLVLSGSLPVGYTHDEPVIEPAVVTVRGPLPQVLLVSEVRAELSISNYREDFVTEVDLVALDNNEQPIGGLTILPPSVEVIIPVNLEEDIREVAVLLDADFRPALNYYISDITVNPLSVTVRGDPEILATLQSIRTQPISLEELTENVTRSVPLELPEGVKLVDVQTVEVRVTVSAQSGFTSIEVPLEVTGLGTGLEAEVLPTSVVVSLSGPVPVLEAISEQGAIQAVIDLTDLERGSHQRVPAASLVPNDILTEVTLRDVRIVSVLPTLIDVEIVRATP